MTFGGIYWCRLFTVENKYSTSKMKMPSFGISLHLELFCFRFGEQCITSRLNNELSREWINHTVSSTEMLVTQWKYQKTQNVKGLTWALTSIQGFFATFCPVFHKMNRCRQPTVLSTGIWAKHNVH